MKLLTLKQLNRLFFLRERRKTTRRINKKNHKRVRKYLMTFGVVTKETAHLFEDFNYQVYYKSLILLK